MTKTIYLDTNVYLDYYFDRRGRKAAFDILFTRTPGCEFRIAVSDWVLRELEMNGIGNRETRMLFEIIRGSGKMVEVHTRRPEDVENARKISGHFQDPLHAILAKRAGAEILVTRNIQDFACCRGLISVKLPEDI